MAPIKLPLTYFWVVFCFVFLLFVRKFWGFTTVTFYFIKKAPFQISCFTTLCGKIHSTVSLYQISCSMGSTGIWISLYCICKGMEKIYCILTESSLFLESQVEHRENLLNSFAKVWNHNTHKTQPVHLQWLHYMQIFLQACVSSSLYG